MTSPNLKRCFRLGIALIGAWCIAGTALAQEMVYPITIHTALQQHPDQKMLKARITPEMAKSRDLLQLPFIDDFSVDRFPGNARGLEPLWMGRQATLNFNMPKNPPTIGVVTLDGADEVGYPYRWSTGKDWADTLTSVPMDLTGTASDGIGISFYYQPQGNAVFPPMGNSDSLRLEFYAPELDQWFWAWSTVDVSTPDAFTFVHIPITQPRYLKEGFQFRFRNIASLQGAFDPWHIDYVRVDANSVNATPEVDDVAFTSYKFNLLNNYTAVPRSHFASLGDPSTFMRESMTVQMRNLSATNRTLIGNEIRVDQDGNNVAAFPNPNSPAIQAGAVFDYFHSVGLQPNAFVYEVDDAEGPLQFDVRVLHTVADIAATSSNDTIHFEQTFFTEYAYDDGSAEWGYGVANNGAELALRFVNQMPDAIFGIKIYTMPIGFNYESTPITILIWEDTGNGPGAVIAEELTTVVYGRDEFQESIVYTFPEPVPVSGGSFFVGYRQANQPESIRIGLDRNTNGNEGNLFFKDASQVWTASQIQGTAMIRPMFTSPGWEDIVVSTGDAARPFESVHLYPNPTRDVFYVDLPSSAPAEMRLYDVSGRLMRQELVASKEALATSDLPGGMYIVQFRLASGEVFSKKLVIRK